MGWNRVDRDRHCFGTSRGRSDSYWYRIYRHENKEKEERETQ